MRLPAIALVLALSIASSASANVVRSAPDFSWPGAGNKARSLRSLRGQPVVLVIAPSPRDGAFRKQVEWLKKTYSQLASKGTIFIAAFSQSEEGQIKTDIPFVIANNGPAVASAYSAQGFQLVVIGKDGNVDYSTEKVRTPERIRDVIINNFEMQASSRKQ
jgi:peroxiredoxin